MSNGKTDKKQREPQTLKRLREEVCEANVELYRRALARFTFGNASGIDREAGLIVIKPSGVAYDKLKPKSLVVVNTIGETVIGDLRPSSDTPTHVELYRAFDSIGGVVHTHSMFATVWAQAGREIPCLGTTHADYFHGAVPVTEILPDAEIATEYEANTGRAIARRFATINPASMPAVLVAGHASFCWANTVTAAVNNASFLEEIAEMAYRTLMLSAGRSALPTSMIDKHFLRKHGADKYYGQQ